MRIPAVAVCIVLSASVIFGQSDRGTITGAIADQTGAVIANASIEAKNVQTGATYTAGSSNTGNYTLSQLPAGTYELSVAVPGFKKYIRQNVRLPVAQTLRVDIPLELGAATESVTISAEAPLLKTESGELSHNVTSEQADELPILVTGSGAGVSGIRNPYAVTQLLPGSSYAGDSVVRLNGAPSNTQSFRVEGQDAYSGIFLDQSWTQPSVDAIQEFAIQTSNYAAEYGQAGGGVFNVTMKSGTNQYHGSGYDYFVNEFLNAGQPFTNDGNGNLIRNRQRRNDYGVTLGGPVWIPKVYNGHDKLFFFFNFEQFRQSITTSNVPVTVPIDAYRQGNFTPALTGRTVGKDPLGRPILENQIYDPATQRIVDGAIIRDPFPNNTVPLTDMDPVALKVQSFIPEPNLPGVINNYLTSYTNPTVSSIPSIKIDYSLSPKIKLSGYYSRTATSTPNNTAMPPPITSAIAGIVATHTVRVNYDETVTPTLLLHLGIGFLDTHDDQVPAVNNYDPVTQLGLTGTYTNLFPYISGLSGNQGGFGSAFTSIGPYTPISLTNYKPTANASITWVRNNHTYKVGGEMIIEGYPARVRTYANGNIGFAAQETGLPSLNGAALAAFPGYSYASFLMGRVDRTGIGVPTDTRLGNHAVSFFAQDSWKATRKLTLDYGLRYDYQTFLNAENGVMPNFSASTPNPSAGGRLGATIFQATCNCKFGSNYPFAFGPRLGVAYQFMPKTVLRAGAGVSYSREGPNAFLSYSVGSYYPITATSYGDPLYQLQNGLPFNITWPNFDPGQYPLPGTTATPLIAIDGQAGRPARQLQWSIGIQREITPSMIFEADYVGNRGVWWTAPALINVNAIPYSRLAADGIDLSNPAAAQALLTTKLINLPADSPYAALPYPGFPTTQTVAQTLRPFPQFGGITYFLSPPLGDTWYDSLQTKLTKRFSHGLDLQSSFTWSKQLDMGVESSSAYFQAATPVVNDVFNRQNNKYLSAFDQPFLFVFSGTYTLPKLDTNKALSWGIRDWQIGGLLRYGSGLPIAAPTATNGLSSSLFQSTFANRVPGAPLFTQNLNCHCFDPNTTFVLNPAAWSQPGPLQFGTAAAYYSDYRYQRRPVENISLGRVFRVKERASLQIRAEFTNIFNRTEIGNPSVTNAGATQLRSSTGQTLSGFGYINTATTFAAPRQGQLVARFSF